MIDGELIRAVVAIERQRILDLLDAEAVFWEDLPSGRIALRRLRVQIKEAPING